MKDREPKPTIIDEINKSLAESIPENRESPTVERIAEKLGISKNVLYRWVETDAELSEAFGRLKKLQDEDPFKTGDVEDSWISSLVIAFILMETRDRHYKPHNQ